MENKNTDFISLKHLGFERYYIGLKWFSINVNDKRVKVNKKLIDLQESTERRFGVINNRKNTNGEVYIGLAPELTSAYYSAAQLVHSIVTAENFIFVEELDDNQFWYFLVVNGHPATGTNDFCIKGSEDLFEKIVDDIQIWELNDRKVVYLIPEIIQNMLSEVGLDKSDFSTVTFKDLYDTTNNYKVARISELKGINKSYNFSFTTFLKISITAAILSSSYFVFIGNDNNNKNKSNLDSLIAAKRQEINSQRNKLDLLERKSITDNERKFELDEESKWISQQINSGSPDKILDHLLKYIYSLPADIKGWYPSEVIYTLLFKTNVNKSSISKPGKIDVYRNIKTTWTNGGTSTVGDFENSISDSSNLIYDLNGLNVSKTESKPVIDSQQLNYDDIKEYLNKSKYSYLKIINLLQEFTLDNSEFFRWTASVKVQNQRLIPYVYESTEEILNTNQITYSKVNIIVNINGFGTGFNTLEKFKKKISVIKNFIITEVRVSLQNESIQISGYYIHPNISING